MEIVCGDYDWHEILSWGFTYQSIIICNVWTYLQVLFLGKSFVTMLADKRPLSGVNTLVWLWKSDETYHYLMCPKNQSLIYEIFLHVGLNPKDVKKHSFTCRKITKEISLVGKLITQCVGQSPYFKMKNSASWISSILL